MLSKPRSVLESDLARSLSRHIGYTTGAYSILRIANVLVHFKNRPSVHQYEVLKPLMDQSLTSGAQLKESYAAEILNFAVGLGLIQKVAEGPTANLARYAPTPEGATIKGALEFEEGDLIRFVLLGQLLEFDADAYCVLLEVLSHSELEGGYYRTAFRERHELLRDGRIRWVKEAISNRTLLQRVVSRIPWMKTGSKGELAAKPLKPDFGRHHATPRRGWAIELGHLRSDGGLTLNGTELLGASRGDELMYVWLGPPAGTQEALGIPESLIRRGPFSPSWNLLRPTRLAGSDAEIQELAEATADYMVSHYDQLRLVHANQASIASVMPFVHFTERNLGFSVASDTLLDRVFRSHPYLHLLSSRHSRYGYYQWRRR